MENASEAQPPAQPPAAKRTRHGPTDLEQILEIGREAMRRNKKNRDANLTSLTEDRRFREMFGCGILVAHDTWMHLEADGSLESRSIEDMMRALMFMKSYGKEGTMSVMVGTIDEKTYRKRLWPMVEAIGALESTVVGACSCQVAFAAYIFFFTNNVIFSWPSCRLIGTNVSPVTLEMIVLCLWTAQTFAFNRDTVKTFFHTSSKALDFGMKSGFVFSRGTLCGSMDPTNVVCGMTYLYSVILCSPSLVPLSGLKPMMAMLVNHHDM
jgi:hypothetical protein